MMYNIKNSVFQFLSPRQKSALLSFLKSFVKKRQNLSRGDIIDEFIAEENYYIEINNPHFEFLAEYFSNDDFLRDMRIYIDSVFEELKQKEALKPIIERQKQFQKQQRKRANDFKMSKLPPTKKQLMYYEKISRAHKIEMKPTQGASRLDLRNWIMEIIDPKEDVNE